MNLLMKDMVVPIAGHYGGFEPMLSWSPLLVYDPISSAGGTVTIFPHGGGGVVIKPSCPHSLPPFGHFPV